MNIDWLECFCLEPAGKALDAGFFKGQGIVVRAREYGTPLYREMFTVSLNQGQVEIEIRRNPYSLKSAGGIFQPGACHLRLTNRTCYNPSPIGDLRQFIIAFGYQYQSLSRIDICMDILHFDDGSDPAAFLLDYATGKIFKQHLSRISPRGVEVIGSDFQGHGTDKPYHRQYTSWKWGAPSSMLSVKLYDKTKELADVHDKSYIRSQWLSSGLITKDDFLLSADIRDARYNIGQLQRNIRKSRGGNLSRLRQNLVAKQAELRELSKREKHVWRVEFSMSSDVKGFISGDTDDCDKAGHRRIYPMRLDIFDNRGKLLYMFNTLARRYFHFKMAAFTRSGQPKRKDRCPDYWPISFNPADIAYTPVRAVNASDPSRIDKIIINKLRRIIDDNNDHAFLEERQRWAVIQVLQLFKQQYRMDELDKVVDRVMMDVPDNHWERLYKKSRLIEQMQLIMAELQSIDTIS